MSEPTEKPLLPCPFCGQPVWIDSFMGDGFRLARVSWEQIRCENCQIETEPEQPGCRKPDLVTRWNTRAPSAELTRTTESVEIGSKSVVAAPQTPRTDRWQALYDDTETVLSAAKEMRQLETELTQAQAETAAMRAERDEARRALKLECQDWADDDTRVKAIAAEFGIKDCHENHDAFKGVIEIAEEMAVKIREANALVDRLAGVLEKAERIMAQLYNSYFFDMLKEWEEDTLKPALAEVAKSLSPRTTENTKPQ